jgi:hypothetical protein
MPTRVTIDLFSGRPNPQFVLTGLEERELLERLAPTEKAKKPSVLPEFHLGYRGLIIEQLGNAKSKIPTRVRVATGELFGNTHYRTADPCVEEFVCGSTGPIRRANLSPAILDRLPMEIERLSKVRELLKPGRIKWPIRERCPCGPLYEPSWWNDGGQRQWNNNCYNYGVNYRTDTFAQPGRAAGAMYTALSCAAVSTAALADDLLPAPDDNKCPVEGHLVALVVAPGIDFHWYRKGRNGMWTHKPGSTPATNLDNSGKLIADPRTADRGMYTDFCSFMVVMHGHVKLQ